MAYSGQRTPISYSTFIVTIGISRLVSEIFACDAQTDRWADIHTTRTITIAGPHTVAGQLTVLDFYPVRQPARLAYYNQPYSPTYVEDA